MRTEPVSPIAPRPWAWPYDRTVMAVLAVLIGGCATAPPTRPGEMPSQAQSARGAKGPAVEVGAPSLDQSPPLGSQLTVDLPGGRVGIRRAELARIQKAGPHWLLERVKVRRKLKRGSFIGWRVVSYAGPGELAKGDIVRRVNGRSVERPEQFIDVWNGMTKRDKLEIELLRSGKQLLLSFPLQ